MLLEAYCRIAGVPHKGALAIPLLLGFASDCRRRQILDLYPAVGAAAPVRGPQALRYDPLATERASLTIDDRAVRDEGAR
jgi:hypothetical protein